MGAIVYCVIQYTMGPLLHADFGADCGSEVDT